MAGRRDIEVILREIGAAQHGIGARAQLLERGIAARSIDRMVETGRLVVLHRGIYQIGPRPMPRAGEAAAVLAGGAECRLSHGSAARLHELLACAGHDILQEVPVSRRKRRHLDGVRVHRVRDMRSDETTTVDGIPITTPARTLLDMRRRCRPGKSNSCWPKRYECTS